ncbi:MAG: NYN domain-containing protein, partial [Pseudomonadota bacterium]|nr:NYN domain-containing protein [Pseudomonadota bacterium]
MDDTKQKIAVFIDADNAPASKFDVVLSELAKYGVVNIRRAYGNWKNTTLKPWEEILYEYSI